MSNLLNEMKSKLENVEGADEFYSLLDELDLSGYKEITEFNDEQRWYTIASFVLDNKKEILLQYKFEFLDYEKYEEDMIYIPDLVFYSVADKVA